MKVMEIIKIKDVSELEGHKKGLMDKKQHSDNCYFNRYLKNFPKGNNEGYCWCKLNDITIKKFKLSQYEIFDDDENSYDLRHNLDEYFRQRLPDISSRNILRKNRAKIKSRFFPTIIPSQSKFDIPKFGYSEYIIDSSVNKNFQFGQAQNCYIRDPKAKQGNLNQGEIK